MKPTVQPLGLKKNQAAVQDATHALAFVFSGYLHLYVPVHAQRVSTVFVYQVNVVLIAANALSMKSQSKMIAPFARHVALKKDQQPTTHVS